MKFSSIILATLLLLSAASFRAQNALEINTVSTAITELRPIIDDRAEKRPMLIKFWATWCGPCRVEFPGVVRLDAEYRARGLDVVIVSLDNFGAMDSRVADFLQVYKSTMPSYLLDLPNRNQIAREMRKIAPQATGGLPFTVLVNKDGKAVYQRHGVISRSVLRARIERLLPKKHSPPS